MNKAVAFVIALLSITFYAQEIPPRPPAPKASSPHQADLAYTNPQCNTSTPCNLQIYRAQCDNATTCPNYIYSPQSFKTLDMSTVQNVVTATNTSWTYSDTDSALQDNTTYMWVATAAYKANPTMASGPSTPFQGTFSSSTPPIAPTTGACKIVK